MERTTKTFQSERFSRNSHIPACTECRIRKIKCSKSRPSCTNCKSSNRKCVYSAKPDRTPLTREHLTAVETRLQLLENALESLFPDGGMQDITRLLLMNRDQPQDRRPSSGSSEHTYFTNSSRSNALLQDFSDHNIEGSWQSESLDQLWRITSSQPPTALDNLDFPSLSRNGAVHEPVSEQRTFINSYFQNYHKNNPLVHEPTFRAEYENNVPIADLNAWPILVNMILAIGAWMVIDGPSEKATNFYETAKWHSRQLQPVDESSLTMIQGLLLLSDYAQKGGRPEESCHALGTSIRIAVRMRLHLEPSSSDPGLSPLNKEIRRRVWWTLYCSESCSAKIYGRPLLLPEDKLITVSAVSNISEMALTSSTTSPPTISDGPTIYSGLILQSSYHRMANNIYRRVLSMANITAQDVWDFEQTIDSWHTESPFCSQEVDVRPTPDWYLISRDRQTLCDRSLRLLIRRPLLLRWLKRSHSLVSCPKQPEQSETTQCLRQGVSIARSMIDFISGFLHGDRCPKVLLPFILYSLFHATLVPVIHFKADPSSPESISCVQDVERVNGLLESLPSYKDALSLSFYTVLKRLRSLTTSSYDDAVGNVSQVSTSQNPNNEQTSMNNIFGNEELAILESHVSRSQSEVNFSQWVNTSSLAEEKI